MVAFNINPQCVCTEATRIQHTPTMHYCSGINYIPVLAINREKAQYQCFNICPICIRLLCQLSYVISVTKHTMVLVIPPEYQLGNDLNIILSTCTTNTSCK